MDSKTKIQLIQRRFGESQALLKILSLDLSAIKVIVRISEEIIRRLRAGSLVAVFGNGGSAADAQHFAAELIGGYANHHRRALNVLALSTNTSALTAIGNDYGYDEVFSRQIEAHGKKDGLVIGISTSGNSKNILKAFKKAKGMGMLCVGLTGARGGKMKDAAHIIFRAPSESTPRIQEIHINTIHAICEIVERELFG
ncbi:MAG: SIS domain-containing protein [Elusimicrobia bacterium]|nr:SIS domain-containing protein [Elusimicrobiota bacterium]